MKNKRLLTIAIPTFKRSKYLDLCLKSICNQLRGLENEIELIVSDNCSTDNTEEIVQSHINNGYEINYYKNNQNIGADKNVERCFSLANGNYFWCFGDDDIVLDGKLSLVVEILKKQECGFLFCNNYWFKEDPLKESPKLVPINPQYTIYNDHMLFFSRVHYWFTFLTGCIINKSLLGSDFESKKFLDSSLNHVAWNIESFYGHPSSVFIEEYVIACKSGNTGGYKLVTVFAKNYSRILKELISRGGCPQYILPITLRNLFEKFFPQFIDTMVYTDKKFAREKHFWELFKLGWSYKSYWKFVFPKYIRVYMKKWIKRN